MKKLRAFLDAFGSVGLVVIASITIYSQINNSFYQTVIQLDDSAKKNRSDAVALARYCFGVTGAVATIAENTKDDIIRVECSLRVKK